MNLSVFENLENVKENTLKSYLSNSRRINDFIKDDKELLNVKKMLKILDKITKSANSKTNYLSTIQKYLSLTGLTNEKVKKQYTKHITKFINEFQSKPKKLDSKIKNIDYKKKKKEFIKKLKNKEYETDLFEFIISFYLLLPPRRSIYQDITFTTSKNDIQSDKNYLLKKGKSYTLIFNNFKTSDSIGTQKIKIRNSHLLRILNKKELKENEKIYHKSKVQFHRDFKKMTKLVFDVELTINQLRVLHSSKTFDKKNMKKLVKDAKLSAHSVNTKINNYIR